MKKQSFNLFTSLSKKDFLALTVEVKETVAFGLTETPNKIFTSAELWNVHRQVKSRVQRRYL